VLGSIHGKGGGSQTESYPVSLERTPGNIPIPRVQLPKSPWPRPAQISRAVLQTFSDTGQTLRGKEIFQLSQPLIIFDQLEVEGVRVKGEDGLRSGSVRCYRSQKDR
jgi:hypothetical protein